MAMSTSNYGSGIPWNLVSLAIDHSCPGGKFPRVDEWSRFDSAVFF